MRKVYDKAQDQLSCLWWRGILPTCLSPRVTGIAAADDNALQTVTQWSSLLGFSFCCEFSKLRVRNTTIRSARETLRVV